jgi:hypothetical protein
LTSTESRGGDNSNHGNDQAREIHRARETTKRSP